MLICVKGRKPAETIENPCFYENRIVIEEKDGFFTHFC